VLGCAFEFELTKFISTAAWLPPSQNKRIEFGKEIDKTKN
jgi:hypothetical protein